MRNLIAPFARCLLGALLVAALCLPLLALAQPQTGPCPPPAVPVAAEADNVHVLLVADTDDVSTDPSGERIGGVGPLLGHDIRAMQKLLRLAERTNPDLRGRLKVTALTGRNATPARVRAYYRDLDCGRNDNLFFFLACHGCMVPGRDTPEAAHVLAVNSSLEQDGRMDRIEVRRLMEAKRPRGLVLLTGSCSSYAGTRPGPARPDESVRRSEPGAAPNGATVRNLLFRAPRLIDVTAAQDGNVALAGHVGSAFGGAEGAFTVALLHLLCDRERTFRTWTEPFPALDAETFAASGRVHRPRRFSLRDHSPRPPLGEPATGPIAPSS